MARPEPFEVRWMPSASRDLEGIALRIAEDGPDRALEAVVRVEGRAAALASFPDRGRIVPELAAHGVHAYRELVIAPWRLVYRIDARRVKVHAVFDGRRNLEDVLLERLLGRA